MKFPLSMLRDFVDTPLSALEVGDLLTMAGFELEGIGKSEGDDVLDVKTMANRGDGLSVLGLAREVLAKVKRAKPTALYRRAVARFPLEEGHRDRGTKVKGRRTKVEGRSERANRSHLTIQNPNSKIPSTFDGIEIQTPDCPRYACRLFRDISNAPSPEWLQKRLRQAGMRPISLPVDLANFVMLEMGQPLHAFDFDTLKGGRIVVRKAKSGEKLVTLDGEKRDLNPDQMMICDAERPVAIAGIMGGAETECTSKTKNVLLESAHFEPRSIRRTRKQLGLSTEASYRFERYVDPDGVIAALNRYAELLAQVDQGKSRVPGIVDVRIGKPKPAKVKVRIPRAEMLLGIKFSPSAAKGYLTKLGFKVSGAAGTLTAVSPTWRPDVTIEEDLIEEIGRVHGYDQIPAHLPEGTTTQGGVFGMSAFTDDARRAMVNLGFVQIVSHSIREISPLDANADRRVLLKNPLSPETAFLRDSLLPGLAEAARRNGGRDVHLFEIGRVFLRTGKVEERVKLAALSIGALEPPHWSGPKPPEADFFSMKGALSELASSLSASVTSNESELSDTRFHPMRQSAITTEKGNKRLGTFGQIHPDVADALGLPATTILAEIDLKTLYEARSEEQHFKPFSRNPAVRRDVSFHYPKEIHFAKFEDAIRSACGELLEDLSVFDLYEGANIPEGHRNVAVAMNLRAFGENLTDEQANQVRDRVAAALESLGAKLR